jgi:hypothetical protein
MIYNWMTRGAISGIVISEEKDKWSKSAEEAKPAPAELLDPDKTPTGLAVVSRRKDLIEASGEFRSRTLKAPRVSSSTQPTSKYSSIMQSKRPQRRKYEAIESLESTRRKYSRTAV